MLISQWMLLGLIAAIGIIVTIGCFATDSPVGGLATILIVTILIGGLALVLHWYNTSTASGARAVKDQQSELSNGLERSIVVTAEDGREIYRYEGKCDIETDNGNYILFEDANRKRVIIYKGVQDTIIITEK